MHKSLDSHVKQKSYMTKVHGYTSNTESTTECRLLCICPDGLTQLLKHPLVNVVFMNSTWIYVQESYIHYLKRVRYFILCLKIHKCLWNHALTSFSRIFYAIVIIQGIYIECEKLKMFGNKTIYNVQCTDVWVP